MRPKILIYLFTVFHFTLAAAQSVLPITEYPSAKGPLIIYISGDGGMNTFSNSLCTTLQQNGSAVSAIDARSYFWKKKTPAIASADLNEFLRMKMAAGVKEVYIVGYSFGADVIPFILADPAEPMRSLVKKVIMISPSTSTDMEIHLGDMLGSHAQRSMDVPSATAKLNWLPVHCIFGEDEKDFPVTSIHLPLFTYQYLAGGHHFNSDTRLLGDIISGKR